MVQEFEDVVFDMNPGEVSDIFVTQFGYHVARMEDRRESGPVPYEEARAAILERLEEESRQDMLDQYVDSLKEKADIVREGESS